MSVKHTLEFAYSALQGMGKPLELAARAEKAGFPEHLEAVYKIVRHLEANHRGVVLQGDRAQPSSLSVFARSKNL